MKKSFDISKEENIPSVIQELMPLLQYKIILLQGELGAGKTTFVQYFLKELGSLDPVNSPTYSIVNEYEIQGKSVYHFDLYRLHNIEEVYDIGIDDYLQSGEWCFIEWPEIFKQEIAENYHEMSIFMEDKQRILNLDA